MEQIGLQAAWTSDGEAHARGNGTAIVALIVVAREQHPRPDVARDTAEPRRHLNREHPETMRGDQSPSAKDYVRVAALGVHLGELHVASIEPLAEDDLEGD